MNVFIDVSQYLCKYFDEEDKMWVYYLSGKEPIGSIKLCGTMFYYDDMYCITGIDVNKGFLDTPHNDLLAIVQDSPIKFKDINTFEVYKIKNIKGEYILRHCKTNRVITT